MPQDLPMSFYRVKDDLNSKGRKADKRNKQGLTTMATLSMWSYECYVNPRGATGRGAEMPRSCSIFIQSLTAWRTAFGDFTEPGKWMARG